MSKMTRVLLVGGAIGLCIEIAVATGIVWLLDSREPVAGVLWVLAAIYSGRIVLWFIRNASIACSLLVERRRAIQRLVTTFHRLRLPVTREMAFADDAMGQLEMAANDREANREAVAFALTSMGYLQGVRQYGGVVPAGLLASNIERALDVYKADVIRTGRLDTRQQNVDGEDD